MNIKKGTAPGIKNLAGIVYFTINMAKSDLDDASVGRCENWSQSAAAFCDASKRNARGWRLCVCRCVCVCVCSFSISGGRQAQSKLN